MMSIKFKRLLIASLVISSICIYAQPPVAKSYRLGFYNLENLFDPSDAPHKNDEEFTPEGMRNWSEYRYREKSNRMAKAILSIGEWVVPDIVGVAEIENRKVLEDLVNSAVLRKFNYKIIHFESPDRRGIDVAMLYRPASFTIIYTKNIAVKMPGDPHFVTRDILYVKGILSNNDTLHLMYCHWPSRYGGQAKSEPKRIQAALTVRSVVDSLWEINENARIIIAGDLNDEWNNISILKYLRAFKVVQDSLTCQLVNLMATMPVDEGSHRYHGRWAYLDQIIVSSNLLNGSKLEIKGATAQTAKRGFLLEMDEKYPGVKPFRSFIGMRYHGGFSDHLPVYIDLYQK